MSDEIPREQVVESGLSYINIEDEMSSSYIDYSMSVIIGRALPDARDGLKPVHRRVLYAMNELSNVWNKPYKKSARVVGDVIGKYHPHGDQAVYDTIVRLAQDFSMRYPLVDGQGNFGSIDGDPPAAMRYTEVRMDRLTEDLLDDLDKNTVDFRPNYNEEFLEPTVLPARLPNLLLNGSTGIAVGMATNIPPHNLGELCEGIIHYIDNKDCSIDDLMQFVKGPDFPTGAKIYGTRGIEAMYKLGRGSIVIRGCAEVVEYKKKEAIIITEIPYMVNKASMIEKMADLVNNKVIEGITDIRDESSSAGIRIVVELKRGTMGQVVLNNLYKHTQLQTTFGANMLAIDQGRPKRLTLKEFFRCYVDHRFEVITRRTRFDLDKALARRHVLDGLLIALDNLDDVVRIIRASKEREEAKNSLMERFGFSEIQVNAILEMRLYQLTGLEREKIENEYKQLVERIEYLEGLLASSVKIYELIKTDLFTMKERFTGGKKADERRSDIIPVEGEVNIEDLIADEPCVVTLSQRGYIKRVPLSIYREQRRGGKGITGASIKDEDFLTTVFVAETHDTLLFFTNYGRVFAARAFEIPEAPRTSFGKPIVNILQCQEGEKVTQLLPTRAFEDNVDVMFATERGTVKKTALAAYKNINRNGIRAINITDDDRLVMVRLTRNGDDILMITAKGKAMRFNEADVRRMGRTATGVRGIRLVGDDVVRSLDVVDNDATLVIATENGYGKRTEFSGFTRHRRGGQGMIAIKDDGRNGYVVAAHAVKDGQSLMMITSAGLIVRSPVDQIGIVGRSAKGVRLIRMDGDAKLVSASIAEGEESDEVTPASDTDNPDSPPPANSGATVPDSEAENKNQS
jgi:DNA gyrase subunit A